MGTRKSLPQPLVQIARREQRWGRKGRRPRT